MRRYLTRWPHLMVFAAACSLAACDGGSSGRGTTGGTTGWTNGGTNGGTTGGGTNGGTGGDDGGVHVNPGGTNGTTGDGNNCGVQNFTLQHGSIPELIIVQDRSGSMDDDPSGGGGFGGGGANSKWNQIVPAIEQTVAATPTIEWGLEMFPDVKSDPISGTGCEVPSQPDVPVMSNDSSQISAALNAAMPGGLTPTKDAINTAVTFYNSVDNDGHPKYLLLATDGEPNCGSGTDDNAEAVMAIANAAAAGFHTFVAGIGSSTADDQVLTDMANAGMEPNTTPGQKAYYEVSSTQNLKDVLTKIAGQIVSCSYTLQMAPQNPDLVTIQSGSMTIPRDPTHMDGWDFGPMNLSIVFYGAACQDLQNGVTQSISAVYGCPPIS